MEEEDRDKRLREAAQQAAQTFVQIERGIEAVTPSLIEIGRTIGEARHRIFTEFEQALERERSRP